METNQEFMFKTTSKEEFMEIMNSSAMIAAIKSFKSFIEEASKDKDFYWTGETVNYNFISALRENKVNCITLD